MPARASVFPLCISGVGNIEIGEIEKTKHGYRREIIVFGDEGDENIGEPIIFHSEHPEGLKVGIGPCEDASGLVCDDCNLSSRPKLTKWDGRYLCLRCLKAAEKTRASLAFLEAITKADLPAEATNG